MRVFFASLALTCVSGVSASHPAVTALEKMVSIFNDEIKLPQKAAQARATKQLSDIFAKDAVMWFLDAQTDLATEESWAKGGYCTDAATIALD